MSTDGLTNVADVITAHARATPGATALLEGTRTWSYAELDRAIWRAGQALRAAGVVPGMRVGVMLPSNALHLVTAYALARIGAVPDSQNHGRGGVCLILRFQSSGFRFQIGMSDSSLQPVSNLKSAI